MVLDIHLLAPNNKDKWHPTWKICYTSWERSIYTTNLWDDNRIDSELELDNKDFYKILNTLPLVYKLDYIRYIILEKYGGMYVDMDVELIQNFIPKLNPNKVYIAGGLFEKEYLQNWLMFSVNPEHKALWTRIKWFARDRIMDNLELASKPENAFSLVGSRVLTDFFNLSNYFRDKSFEVLGYEHFGNPNATISFTKHYTTGTWI